jgi:hypothetical protein
LLDFLAADVSDAQTPLVSNDVFIGKVAPQIIGQNQTTKSDQKATVRERLTARQKARAKLQTSIGGRERAQAPHRVLSSLSKGLRCASDRR